MKKPKRWLEKKCYVYIYYDVDGTPIYVGIGSRMARWREHWKRDTHLGRLLHKRERDLGISLYPEFIEAGSFEDAKLGEVLYIWCFGRKDLGLGPLLNGTDGGDGLTNPSSETRSKIAATRKGVPRSAETTAKMSAARKGVPLGPQSAEHKARISAAQKGIPKSAEVKAKRSKTCTVDGITIYPSRNALTAALGNGKGGRRHPNFRYITPVQSVFWPTRIRGIACL